LRCCATAKVGRGDRRQLQAHQTHLVRHFAALKDAGLILAERRGTQIIYSLNLSLLEEALFGLMQRLSRGWRAREGGAWSFDRRG
jgi:DNA-binding transcriptional ArsR family regulator